MILRKFFALINLYSFHRWEPIENLEGSEEALSTFLGRIYTGGRDYRKLALFKQGESFLPLPVGPPKSTAPMHLFGLYLTLKCRTQG
jgi:hypothetical protein